MTDAVLPRELAMSALAALVWNTELTLGTSAGFYLTPERRSEMNATIKAAKDQLAILDATSA